MGDWREKLAKQFGVEKPKEEKKDKDWKQEAEKYNSNARKNGGSNFNRNNFQQDGRSDRQGQKPAGKSRPAGMATAPYNFVTLPDMIVPSPLDQNLNWQEMKEEERLERYKAYILTQGKLSGKLELELETVTPCFIGGNGESFYAPNGKPVIPGSTLRGLTKNLMKMVTCGAMRRDEDFYDHHLYFRDIASTNKNLRDYYQNRMVETVEFTKKDGTKGSASRTKADPGFLIRVKGDYFICPAQSEKKPVKNQFEKATIHWYAEGSADIITNPMRGKKIFMHIKDPVWDPDKQVSVPKKVVEEYQADKTRKGLNLFKNAKTGTAAGGFTHRKEVDFVVPCFYVAHNGVVQHFGHGRYYRIPYLKSIGDQIPENMQRPVIDFTDALYGSKELWAGRLSFEDAQLIGNPELLKKSFSHPLMSPNPTSYQLYLKQNDYPAKHWDDETEIRGYKLYWHQKIDATGWQIGADENFVKGMSEIQPLAGGNRFKGVIRFSHLSEVELGALCSLFCLGKNGEDIVYKIGQGKSIGMGSIRIKAKLFIEDTKARYSKLFEGENWNVSIAEADVAEYCGQFISYQNEKLGENRKRFEVGMQELRTILNWNQTKLPDWKDKTAMMNPTKDKFDLRLKDRVILKDAISFVSERFKR